MVVVSESKIHHLPLDTSFDLFQWEIAADQRHDRGQVVVIVPALDDMQNVAQELAVGLEIFQLALSRSLPATITVCRKGTVNLTTLTGYTRMTAAALRQKSARP